MTTHQERVTADDVEFVVDSTVAALAPGVDRDWSVRAGDIRWSCRKTAIHVADCLVAYAAQLAARMKDDWVPHTFNAERGATPEGLLEMVTAGGRILSAVVRDTPESVRAWHPYGVSDAEGFAAMGVVETLVHGADIASGLSLPYDAPEDVCIRAVARLFPDADAHDDAWELLRWSTGRLALPGRPRRHRWIWRCEPAAES